MEYFKKSITSGSVTLSYFYAKDNLNLHIFSKSVTDNTKWNYTYQTGTQDSIDQILSGATGAIRTELDPPINQIQTTLTGL
jgi:hypothetical protein